MKRTILSALILMLVVFACPATAQTVNPAPAAKYHVYVYAPGVDATNAASPTAIPSFDLLAGVVACNQPVPTVSNPVTNPTGLVWDDPVNAGKACVVNLTGQLGALAPANGYTYVAIPESAAGMLADRGVPSVPFNWQPKPATLTGLRVK